MSAAPEGVLDTTGMWDVTAAFPEQVEHAAKASDSLIGLPSHDEIENVVVLGMGGSGIAGDIMTAVAGPFMPVPIVVTKGYEPPSFVGPTTLCFALSFSGNTEETVEAAQTAALAGARMVVIAKGGELARLAQSWDATLIGLPDGIPYPRAGVGAMSVPTLLVLEQIGLFPGASGWVDLAVEQLKVRRDELFKDDNGARELARRIGRTMPIVYGGGGLGARRRCGGRTSSTRTRRCRPSSTRCPSSCTTRSPAGGSTATSPARCSRSSCCATTTSIRRSCGAST